MPLKPCLGPCGRLIAATEGPRCPDCRRQYDRRRDAPSRAFGYRTSAWRRVSRTVLARDRVCRKCGLRPSKIAHHLGGARPIDEGGLDPNRVVGLCASCHQLEHKR
jgi:hypothetical protein